MLMIVTFLMLFNVNGARTIRYASNRPRVADIVYNSKSKSYPQKNSTMSQFNNSKSVLRPIVKLLNGLIVEFLLPLLRYLLLHIGWNYLVMVKFHHCTTLS